MNAASPATASFTRLDVAEALRAVIDPELGVNVVDLGLVYDVRVDGGEVEVDLTMTTPACPLSSYITQQIEVALRPLPGLEGVHVMLVWSPRWSPAMMAEALRPERRPAAGRRPFRLFRRTPDTPEP
ncbi:MAG TPA: metal-sulfur cluster assembly factor [Rubricoccaceae bacterium]|nr:metal-sulfur cluster assembly factor [Rubricoccaceae bacterium]